MEKELIKSIAPRARIPTPWCDWGGDTFAAITLQN